MSKRQRRPYNKCGASCNGSDKTYEMINLRSQTVLKQSGANCERGIMDIMFGIGDFCNNFQILFSLQFWPLFLTGIIIKYQLNVQTPWFSKYVAICFFCFNLNKSA